VGAPPGHRVLRDDRIVLLGSARRGPVGGPAMRQTGTVIENLPRVVPAPPGKPVREEAAEGQARARRLAEQPGTWGQAEAAGMVAHWDEAAASWESDRGGYRRPPLADALARGGPFPPGRALEIACGTGLMTPLISEIWPDVAGLDLSSGMLGFGTARNRLRTDVSRLPLADGSMDAVVICDGPLFAAEVARVMTSGAVLVWSNALGTGAPFHLPTTVLAETMTAAAGHDWDVVQSEAHWGSWAVLRPA